MTISEFQFLPTRWAMMTVTAGTLQADVDALFTSIDTSGWYERPRWDAAAVAVRYQIMQPPYMAEALCGVDTVIAVERQYFRGTLYPSPQAQVIAYPPGVWDAAKVTFL